MKTWTPSKHEIDRNWHIVDAEGKVLGRLCTEIANILRGKNKPEYTPHIDTGDFVVVVNAEKFVLTGKKMETKRYYRHSGWFGGIKSLSAVQMLEQKPEMIIHEAVKGMLPQNKMRDKLLLKLKIYAGPEHPHTAQKPAALSV
jgi:large subunit ribosomal protein L13